MITFLPNLSAERTFCVKHPKRAWHVVGFLRCCCFAPKELHCSGLEIYSNVNWGRNIPETGAKHFPFDQLV